jgi:antitoxin (DNA-binding transcriptional repressor) of toxin-antitoxin stability system
MCYMGTSSAAARRTPDAEETVGVRELRQNLSVYLARLAAGVTFRVTDRGRAVALLVPLPAETSVVARLVASGRATPAKHDLLRLPKLKGRPSRSNASRLQDALNDVRQDIV